MKRKDIALIVVAAVVAGIISLVVAKMLFISDKQRQQTVEVVNPITSDFNLPDTKYFNDKSINPTQLIRINENQTQRPFNGTSQ